MQTRSASSVYIIAEAGVNHNGNVELAKEMIAVASEAGADAVKFQTFCAEEEISVFAPKAAYQKDTTGAEESQLDMVKKLELSFEEHQELVVCCRQKQIQFLSTPFDLQSIDWLLALGLERFKIPSGEITNLPYLRKIGGLRKDLMMSTGMADLGEIEDALFVLTEAGTPKERITILHCNTEYPTPMQDVNLRAMLTIQQAFGVNIGYSDHTLGLEVPIAAVTLGARVIEKHFTLDRQLPGPDHRASLEPNELGEMVTVVRNIECALGTGIKRPSPSERKNMVIARKSIVARLAIRQGDIFTDENITVKRPGSGINPMEWDAVIGTRAIRDFVPDEAIER